MKSCNTCKWSIHLGMASDTKMSHCGDMDCTVDNGLKHWTAKEAK